MGDQAKLTELGAKTYKEQAIWFLNGFWRTHQQEAEKVWTYAQRYASLDSNGLDGSALDEFGAHRFLELNQETLTVVAYREHMRSIGIQQVKMVPLVQFLIFRYRVDWHELVNASQGDNQAEIAKAQELVNTARKSVQDAEVAQRELNAALAELKAQEDAYNNKTADLTAKSQTGGAVSMNRAKAELSQHLAEDPLPLRRAKINTEAAVRKAARTLEAANAALGEAEAFLEEVKRRPGEGGAGAIWWIDRELHEARAYLPTSKGGYKK
eukprot:TRINITY_DN1377_c0_g1_i1.p1 TRINITY_DN1377_c0_g1~~TRINITY_DN1377_c0_g1_i1.p1  ORF type:complete len:308 (-),score=64.45 TRINITY_DN1377_c0_g1_i1:35-838(-)